MPTNISMRGKPEEFYYSPNRDLAHFFPFYMGRTIWGLEEAHREPWLKDYMEFRNITDDDLCVAAQAMAQYVLITIEDVACPNAYVALEKAGFIALPVPVQLAVMAKLGQLVLSGYFGARREATGQTLPKAFDVPGIKDILAAAEAVNERLAEKAAEVKNKELNALRKPRIGSLAWLSLLLTNLREWWTK